MGKGIALQFKKKYPDMFEVYQRACKEGQVQPGRMLVYERRGMLNPQYIINFPTKRHWWSPSSIEDIKTGLNALAEEIRQRHIKSIALPALGCGNGGLDWGEVFPAIRSALTLLMFVSSCTRPTTESQAAFLNWSFSLAPLARPIYAA
jgi:O-acetyl-ADP-ribose deacetylase (regulator of RNase III)